MPGRAVRAQKPPPVSGSASPARVTAANHLASFTVSGVSGALRLDVVWQFNGSYSSVPPQRQQRQRRCGRLSALTKQRAGCRIRSRMRQPAAC